MPYLMGLGTLLMIAIFSYLISDIIIGGAQHLSWSFITDAPLDTGRSGGIAPILVSTGLILLICLMITIPFGIGSALFLSEYDTIAPRSAHFIRYCLDILAGMPSIVFGLFGNAFFCIVLGMGFSIVSGGLTLACMSLPLVIRLTEASFNQLPQNYRQGAAGLGMQKSTFIFSILIPSTLPAIGVALIIGTGRALAETAALIFTSGYVSRMPESVWDSGRAISVHIYDLAMNVPGGEANAYASACLLIFLLLFINGVTRWLTR